MSSPKSWTVVCFEADNAVQAVPTKWLNGDNCLWPALPREKLNNALKHCEYNSCWPSHKARIFRNATYDDYYVARTKAAKAEYCSDLNSDADEVANKRSRKKRILSSEDESEDEILKRPIKKHVKKNVSLPSPPPWNEAGNDEVSFTSDTDNRRDNDIDTDKNGIVETPPVHVMVNTRINEPPSEASTHRCKCNLSQVLYNIQSLLVDVNSKVDKLTRHHQSVSQSVEQTMNENVLEKSKIEFPINNHDKLNEIERFLLSTENYKSLVLYFSKIGGINLYDFVKRCLGGILSDNIAVEYSYIGRKGKKKFCDLMLSKAIIESAEKSGIPKNRRETEISIGLWLRKAKFRNN